MKKIIGLLIVILCALSIYFVLNLNIEKTYRFETHLRLDLNGTIKYKSMTKEFLSKMKTIDLENKVFSSSEYSVIMELNKRELKQIIQQNENKKYFTFYREYTYKPGDKIDNQ